MINQNKLNYLELEKVNQFYSPLIQSHTQYKENAERLHSKYKIHIAYSSQNRDDFQSIDMNYKYQDNCKHEYADYLLCVKSRPQILENQFTYVLPFSQYYSKCKILRDQWLGCQDYRQKQLYEHLRGIFEAQKNNV